MEQVLNLHSVEIVQMIRMPDDNLEKTVAKIRKDMDTSRTLREDLNEGFNESKDTKKNEERKFQIELLKVQQGSDVFGSIISVMASIFVAIITTSITLVLSLSSYIYIGISVSIIGYQIIVAIISVLASWIIFLIFRNRKIKEIERKFHLSQSTEPKSTETKTK